LKAGEISIIKDIFRFLDVDDKFVPNMRKNFNVTVIPKVAFIAKFFEKDSILRPFLKPLIPKLGPKLKAKVLSWNLRKPVIPMELREQLVLEYEEDILKLQDFLKRDLSSWLIA
jgi:hypothetical protein